MFEKYLKRIEPKELAITYQATPAVASTPSQSSHDLSGAGGPRLSRKRSKSRSSTIDTLRLTAEQKCDIAQREIEEYREEIDKLKDESEKILDTFKVNYRINCYIYGMYHSNFVRKVMIIFCVTRLFWRRQTSEWQKSKSQVMSLTEISSRVPTTNQQAKLWQRKSCDILMINSELR